MDREKLKQYFYEDDQKEIAHYLISKGAKINKIDKSDLDNEELQKKIEQFEAELKKIELKERLDSKFKKENTPAEQHQEQTIKSKLKI